ncbi:hypothetical protein AGMMS49957_16120 [Synergistales bacterium]|nr:hypothetical protein AGMMS49957_16120 [Synergistales bacterium]
MSTATVRNEDVMTDFQFRAIVRMVLSILNTNSLEEAKKILENLAEGKTGGKDTIDDDE